MIAKGISSIGRSIRKKKRGQKSPLPVYHRQIDQTKKAKTEQHPKKR